MAVKQRSLDALVGSNVTTGSNGASRPKFSRDDWITSLTDEQRSLLKLEIDTLDDSWLALLKDELTKPYFQQLKRFLQEEQKKAKTVFPKDRDIYSWSRHTPVNTVKVVILGQDPYHNYGQAHGLCFSVQDGVAPPPSLKNIYKALTNDYPEFNVPKSGSLLPWADRGVLLLNAALTVRAHEANSHSNKGWEQFTSRVLQLVCEQRMRGVVFLAWGTPAAKRLQGLPLKNHLVLRSVHPSPLSAARGFFTCGHFRKANEWLSERYGIDAVIDWNCLDGPSRSSSTQPSAITGSTVTESKDVDVHLPIEKKRSFTESCTDSVKKVATSVDKTNSRTISIPESTTDTDATAKPTVETKPTMETSAITGPAIESSATATGATNTDEGAAKRISAVTTSKDSVLTDPGPEDLLLEDEDFTEADEQEILRVLNEAESSQQSALNSSQNHK